MACELHLNKVWVYGKRVGFNSESSCKHVFLSFWNRLLLFHICTPLSECSPSWKQVCGTWAGRASCPAPQLLFLGSHTGPGVYTPLITAFHRRTCQLAGTSGLVFVVPATGKCTRLSWWNLEITLVKAERQMCSITDRLSGVLFKSEMPRK